MLTANDISPLLSIYAKKFLLATQ